jgi:hypothetical protein
MARYVAKKLAMIDLAALSFAAFHRNNETVFKDTSFFDKETDSVIQVVPNKVLMRDGTLQVLQEDKVEAQAAIELLSQDRTMRILKNKPIADFQNTLTNLVMQEECTMSDAGLMAFLPAMVRQIQARQVREEEIATLSVSSEYIGKIGEKVKITLSIMTVRFVQQFNCWSVTGKDSNGNLISFLTSKEECTRDGVYTAKVKRTEPCRYNNGAKVTTLNFVKSA